MGLRERPSVSVQTWFTKCLGMEVSSCGEILHFEHPMNKDIYQNQLFCLPKDTKLDFEEFQFLDDLLSSSYGATLIQNKFLSRPFTCTVYKLYTPY